MAQTIKIKRSTGSAAPSTLASGELAYSKGSGVLYIGDPAAANTPIIVNPDTDLTVTENASTVTIASSTGDNDDIQAATTSLAGVMSAADKTKLDGIDTGAEVNVPTNLGNSATGTALTITSSTGTNTNLPAATTTTWGVMTDEDKTKLDGIEALADVTDAGNVTTSLVAATAISGPNQTTIQGNLGLGTLATLSEVNAATIADNSVGADELNVSGDGTAGQALVSDGDGTFTWSTISVTDNDVNVANLTARLPQITESVTIGDATDVTITTSGDLVVTGDLTVSGTTTTVNSETLTIDDNIVVLNNNVTGTPTENAGIEIERGTATNVLVRWNETDDRWQFTNDGSTYYNIPSSSEYITGVTAGTGLSGGGTSGSVTLNVDLSELTDMTADMVGTDEFIVLDAGADRRKAASEIPLSIFNNDSGFTTHAEPGIFSGGGTPTLASGVTEAEIRSLIGAGTVSSIIIASPDGSISGGGTLTTTGTFNLEVSTIDGGTY